MQVNGSAHADAPARDLQPIVWPRPAGAGDPGESAETAEQTDFAEPEPPDPEATQEFGALVVEQVEAPVELAPAGEAETPAEPAPIPEAEVPAEPAPAGEDWLPPLEPAAIAPEPPVAAPVAAPPAALQPWGQSPPVETEQAAPAESEFESESESETETDSGAEAGPGLARRGLMRLRAGSLRRAREPMPDQQQPQAPHLEPEPAPAAPDATVETAPEPAPETEALPLLGPEPGLRERGRMRRRARYLRRLREVQLRDIGGLVLELHRFGRERPDLVLAKVVGAAETDLELRALERALGEQQPFRELREAGIGGACDHCGAVHGSTDRFCATCGEPLLYEHDPEDPAEPTAEPDGPGA